MKSLCNIFLFLLFPMFSFSQSIVDTTRIWDNLVFYYYPQHWDTEKIKFISDTVIDGLHYKKVIRSLDQYPTNWSFYGYIREDSNKRVFYRISGNEPEKMILSMNIELYDTINVYSLLNFENNEFDNMDYYVYAIDSIMIGDSYKKQYHMASVEGGLGLNEWIDGVGGTSGMLHNWNGYVGGDGFDLLCFTENDTLKYMNPSFNSCYVATGLENKIDENIVVTIFPNPVTYVSTFKIIGMNIKDGVILNLYNSLGKKILTRNNIIEFQIFRNEIPSGIYFYCINSKSKNIGSGKIIIN